MVVVILGVGELVLVVLILSLVRTNTSTSSRSNIGTSSNYTNCSSTTTNSSTSNTTPPASPTLMKKEINRISILKDFKNIVQPLLQLQKSLSADNDGGDSRKP